MERNENGRWRGCKKSATTLCSKNDRRYFKKKELEEKQKEISNIAKIGEDNFLKKGNYEKNDTFVLQHRTCTHVENKIKAEHPQKLKPLCLRT